ncbi:MAG TPA: alanine racemase [Bacteroidales bacterium]|nr:alanine racemase [Bacteroidales bacterium]HQB22006.1 alanine racemase [Bacteroidales bacterium]
MLKINKIKSPTFAVNTYIVRKNIQKMQNKLGETTIFRPHFKTHDNKQTSNIFRELGINKITVSSIEMAIYFRRLGFKDINISFPINFREQKALQKLSKNTNLHLLVSNSFSAKQLSSLKDIKANVWIEIDTGYKRSGISHNNLEEIQNCIKLIMQASHLNFSGFLNHNGETYLLNKKEEILQSTLASIAKIKFLKSEFSNYSPKISIGDTPGCSLLDNFDGIDEIRPGNFVYYDLMMLEKKVCTKEQIATTLFCPIVDINNDRKEIVIHGGAIHFSKEFTEIDNKKIFGIAIKHYGTDISEINEDIVSLSQEHGIVKINNSNFENYKPGNLIEIIPVHSCLAANLMKGKTRHY